MTRTVEQSVLRLSREEALDSLHIASSDLVLEIGSGNAPFNRSNILVDRFLFDESHRTGTLIIDRPAVCADAHRLPFKNQAFDYIFCSQILEHLIEPARFFDEIARVGKRGYIETPNELRERLICRSCHLWVVSLEGQTLVMRKNQLPQIFGALFRNLMANRLYNHFYSCHYWLFNIMIEWRGGIDYRIGPPAVLDLEQPSSWLDDLGYAEAEVAETRGIALNSMPGVNESFGMLIAATRRSICKRLPKKATKRVDRRILSELLICPACGESVKVSWEERAVSCEGCGRIYPIMSDIPILLVDQQEVEQTVHAFEQTNQRPPPSWSGS